MAALDTEARETRPPSSAWATVTACVVAGGAVVAIAFLGALIGIGALVRCIAFS